VSPSQQEAKNRFTAEAVRRTLEGEGLPTDGVPFLAHGLHHGRVGIIPSPDPLHQPGRHYPGLTTRPWWDPKGFPWMADLEAATDQIRAELDAATDGRDLELNAESGKLTDSGAWRELRLFSKGHEFIENSRRCPKTVEVIRSIPSATIAGSVFFAATDPGTHIVPHFAPHNARLRVHLGVHVPEGNRMRVANETRPWREGEAIIFDDSFEHETWNESESRRVILLFDIWHPDMTPAQIMAVRYSEAPMLAHAWDVASEMFSASA